MTLRVDAGDVLDSDAMTGRALSGRVVGVFRCSGPNEWDDYALVEADGGLPEGSLARWLHGQLDDKPRAKDQAGRPSWKRPVAGTS
jgi:hypothetical protein